MRDLVELDNIGHVLRLARKNKKVTQQELANDLGMSRGSIANIESGFDKPSLTTIQKICEHLGYNMKFYIEEKCG